MSKTTWSRAVEIVDKHNLWGHLDTGTVHHLRNDIHNALDKVYASGVRHGRRKERRKSHYCTRCGIVLPVMAQPDTDHYRSEGKPYDVVLHRDGAKVTARVWDMPEEMRGKGQLICDAPYEIYSSHYPCVVAVENKPYLCLRGLQGNDDDSVAGADFPTVTAARDYFTHITALIDQLNAEYEAKPSNGEGINTRIASEELVMRWLHTVEENECFSLSAHRRVVLVDMIWHFVMDGVTLHVDYKPQSVPAFDADKVKQLIRRFEQAVQHQAGWYTPYSFELRQKEIDDIRVALLATLGLNE